jgi:hypothetical protein
LDFQILPRFVGLPNFIPKKAFLRLPASNLRPARNSQKRNHENAHRRPSPNLRQKQILNLSASKIFGAKL